MLLGSVQESASPFCTDFTEKEINDKKKKIKIINSNMADYYLQLLLTTINNFYFQCKTETRKTG